MKAKQVRDEAENAAAAVGWAVTTAVVTVATLGALAVAKAAQALKRRREAKADRG